MLTGKHDKIAPEELEMPLQKKFEVILKDNMDKLKLPIDTS